MRSWLAYQLNLTSHWRVKPGTILSFIELNFKISKWKEATTRKYWCENSTKAAVSHIPRWSVCMRNKRLSCLNQSTSWVYTQLSPVNSTYWSTRKRSITRVNHPQVKLIHPLPTVHIRIWLHCHFLRSTSSSHSHMPYHSSRRPPETSSYPIGAALPSTNTSPYSMVPLELMANFHELTICHT